MMRNGVLVFLVRHFKKQNTKLKAQIKRLQESAAIADQRANRYEAALFLAETELDAMERCKRIHAKEGTPHGGHHGT